MNFDDLTKLADSITKEQQEFIKDNVGLKQLVYWWIMSFEEHTQTCDQCTLTWADEYCDDYKLLQKVKLKRHET